MNFSFGTDPEMMLVHHNELRSAIGVLPKKNDAKINKDGHKFYYDNVLAEIAIKPATNKNQLINNVQSALQGLARAIKPAKFIIRASANYPSKELKNSEAKIAGCNPEWDVYTLESIYPPDEDVDLMDGYYQFKTSFRSAGGHIHLGADLLQEQMEVHNVIRMMDLFVGIPSIFLDTDETSRDRRRIYGHAGSHRTPDYGLEYRTLGNFWLSSPEYVALIYDLTEFVLNFVNQKEHERFWSVNEELLDEDDPSIAHTCFGYDINLLTEAINNCNKKKADKFMTLVQNILPNNIIKEIDKLSDKTIQDPYKSWELK